MSGIVGIYNLNGAPVDVNLVEQMSARLAHRGPDGAAMWVEGSVGLAQRMLHTTPESLHESQPLSDESGALCLVLDGRVDDREALISQLLVKGAMLRDDTDAELVLKAYEVWGEECPERIIGDFAFAVWDARKRQLFCARDIAGNKPFYFCKNESSFVFGSEIRAVLCHPQVRSEPNEGHIAEALIWRMRSIDETLFRDIRKLPAATAMVVSSRGVKSWTYWSGKNISPLRYRRQEEYNEAFLSIYRSTVRTLLRSAGPVGVRLSGGIDSSSVTALAQSFLAKNGHPGFAAYSVVAPGDPDDESQYIDDMVAKCRIPSYRFPRYGPEPSFYDEQISFYREYPEYPNAVTVDGLRSSAKERGVRVLLTGFGGGDWFEGSLEYFAELCSKFQWYALLRDAVRYSGPGRPASMLLRYGISAGLPQLRRLYRRLAGRTDENLPEWLGAEFVNRTGLRERLRRRSREQSLWSRAQQASYDFALGGLSVHLTELEERADARFDIEARHPLMDRRVVEFALSLPEDQRRFAVGESKRVLRQSMKGLVPDSIRLRGTSAYGSSSVAGVLFSELAAETFAKLRIGELGWVDGGRALQAYLRKRTSFAAGSPEYQFGMIPLWMIFVIERWVRALEG